MDVLEYSLNMTSPPGMAYVTTTTTTANLSAFKETTLTPATSSKYGDGKHPLAQFLETYYSLALMAFGTIGNLLSLAVLSRKAFRTSPIGICLRLLALADLTALYTGPLFFTAKELFNHNFRVTSVASCRIHRWMSYVSVDLSAWTLVVVTTVRLTSVIWPLKNIFTRLRTYITLIVTIVVVIGVNSPTFFLYGTVHLPHRTLYCVATNSAYRYFTDYVWSWLVLIKYSLLPGTILLVMNILLVMRVGRSRRDVEGMNEDSNKQMSISVISKAKVTLSRWLRGKKSPDDSSSSWGFEMNKSGISRKARGDKNRQYTCNPKLSLPIEAEYTTDLDSDMRTMPPGYHTSTETIMSTVAENEQTSKGLDVSRGNASLKSGCSHGYLAVDRPSSLRLVAATGHGSKEPTHVASGTLPKSYGRPHRLSCDLSLQDGHHRSYSITLPSPGVLEKESATKKSVFVPDNGDLTTVGGACGGPGADAGAGGVADDVTIVKNNDFKRRLSKSCEHMLLDVDKPCVNTGDHQSVSTVKPQSFKSSECEDDVKLPSQIGCNSFDGSESDDRMTSYHSLEPSGMPLVVVNNTFGESSTDDNAVMSSENDITEDFQTPPSSTSNLQNETEEDLFPASCLANHVNHKNNVDGDGDDDDDDGNNNKNNNNNDDKINRINERESISAIRPNEIPLSLINHNSDSKQDFSSHNSDSKCEFSLHNSDSKQCFLSQDSGSKHDSATLKQILNCHNSIPESEGQKLPPHVRISPSHTDMMNGHTHARASNSHGVGLNGYVKVDLTPSSTKSMSESNSHRKKSRVQKFARSIRSIRKMRFGSSSESSSRRTGFDTRNRKNRNLTLTVIVFNAVFILCNLPIVIYMTGRMYMFSGKKVHSSPQYVMEICSNYIMYTNNAINFVLYCITGSRFRQELKAMLLQLGSLLTCQWRRKHK